VGTAEAISVLRNRIVSLHVHDNHGLKDEHLWPGDGSIAWPAVAEGLKSLTAPPAAVLEISEKLGDAPAAIPERIKASFEKLG
jgi:sugar phosphate isomerase/epimerase